MDQPHADQAPLLVDAFDHVSAQLELADDGGREVNPASAQLAESDRFGAGLTKAGQEPLLLSVSRGHRADCRPRWD
jgi:hypothetical protein